MDRHRNVVALTDTVVAWSGIVLPRTGFVANNGMGWFDPQEGRANSIAPGKRGLNNMAPVIVLRDGRPLAAAGARGGRKIIGTVAQVISNLVDHRMNAEQALSAPRTDSSEPATVLDARLAPEAQAGLARRGHRLDVVNRRVGAGPAAILIHPETGLLHGAEDAFGDGEAAGYSA